MDKPPPTPRPVSASLRQQTLLPLGSPILLPEPQRRQCLLLLAEMFKFILLEQRKEQEHE